MSHPWFKIWDGSFYILLFEAARDVDPDGYLNTYTMLMCPEHR